MIQEHDQAPADSDSPELRRVINLFQSLPDAERSRLLNIVAQMPTRGPRHYAKEATMTQAPDQDVLTLQRVFTSDSELVDAFLFDGGCRNLTDKTLFGYGRLLQYLTAHAHNRGKMLLQLDGTDIQTYIALRSPRLSPHSINNHLRTFRLFFNWVLRYCEQDGVDPGGWSSPMKTIRLAKTEKVFKKVLTPEQVSRLLHSFQSGEFIGARNHLMTMLCYDAMVRVGELVNIKIEDVDLHDRVVRVLGKSRRERYVPFSSCTAESIHSWLLRFRKGLPGDRLFCRSDGTPIERDRLRKVLCEKRDELGFAKLGPHLLRHSGATQFTANGGSLTVLQHILGHTDIRITEAYQHPDNTRMSTEHDSYSPLMTVPLDVSGSVGYIPSPRTRRPELIRGQKRPEPGPSIPALPTAGTPPPPYGSSGQHNTVYGRRPMPRSYK